ncbi:MAG: glycosyltransferase family 4 protein [Fibrobacterota bacterium]
MRIAFFQRDLPSEKYGGVACQVHGLANALTRRGHAVTVFSLSPQPADALYAVREVALPLRWRASRIARKFFLGYYFAKVCTRDFDVVHTHGDNFLMFRQRPQVRTYYGSALAEALWALRPGRALSQFLLWGLEIAGTFAADKRAAISPGTKKYIPRINAVVPCGVDLARFRPGPEKSVAPSVLFVGDLRGRKRGAFLLARFAEVRRRVPDAELWMVTPTPATGEGVRHFRALPDAELLGLYQRAWVLCSPSRYECFGLPLLEAMACGTPVISSANDGSRFILAEGRCGLRVPDRDLTPALIRLLTDPTERKTLIDQGLVRAKDFDLEGIANRYLELYHELSAEK